MWFVKRAEAHAKRRSGRSKEPACKIRFTRRVDIKGKPLSVQLFRFHQVVFHVFQLINAGNNYFGIGIQFF